MEKNQEVFDRLSERWELVSSSPKFDANSVKQFRADLVVSRESAWVDGELNKELYAIYGTLNADSLMHMIENKCDDLSYLYEHRYAIGRTRSPRRVELVKHILESEPSADLLVLMFHQTDFETEELARKGVEMILNSGVEDFVLRWMLADYGVTGLGRPSKEYLSWLKKGVAEELLSREATRADLLVIIRAVPACEAKAWEQLQQRGFLLGTLTYLVREFPEPYSKFAWEKILEHDATPERMKKISKGFGNPNAALPKYVAAAKDWLEQHAAE